MGTHAPLGRDDRSKAARFSPARLAFRVEWPAPDGRSWRNDAFSGIINFPCQ